MGRLSPVVVLLLVACAAERPAFDREALEDPAACQGCHPDHYREWSSSPHAWASEDPVFLALNAIGQEQTGGALGTFCLKCHAPVAVLRGATTDGLNMAEVPRRLKGVTCYACHQIERVEELHNGGFVFAEGDTFYGGIGDAVEAYAHRSAASPLHDGRVLESSRTCGSCHDVIAPSGLALERTYAEWAESVFGQPGEPGALSCGGCHMPSREGRAAATDGAPLRRVHDHAMPGIDQALVPWTEVDAQRAAAQRDLDASVFTRLCVSPFDLAVTLDNQMSGHGWPSGITHARRAWVEIEAFAEGASIFTTGVTADDGPFVPDDDTWVLGRTIHDAGGAETDLPWEAVTTSGEVLAAAVTNDPLDPAYDHSVTRAWPLATTPDRVEIRLKIRALPLQALDLFASLGLATAEHRARVATYTLASSEIVWTRDLGFGCLPF